MATTDGYTDLPLFEDSVTSGDDSTTPSVEDHLRHLNNIYLITLLVVQKILVPIVVLFGCIGNTINIAILTRPGMLTSTNWYLTCLAVYDMLYLLFSFSLSLNHYDHVRPSGHFLKYKTYFAKAMTDIFSNTGTWITVSFTIERYIVVCYPLKGKVWCTRTKAKQIVALVCVLATLITFPEFFSEYVTTKTYTSNTTNITTYKLKVVQTAFGKSTLHLVYQYFNQAMFTFLPLILLGVFNTLLIRTLIKAARRRFEMTQQMSAADKNQAKDQQRVTMMLIAVVIVFLCCQLPSALTVLYTNANQNMSDKQRLELKIAGNFLNLLVMTNSSVNFVLYSSFSSKFRQTFNEWFCRCLDDKPKPSVRAGPGPGSNPDQRRFAQGVRKSITAMTLLSGGVSPSATSPSIEGSTTEQSNGKDVGKGETSQLLSKM